ncbi:Sugar kinase of the NBD/HSP70 family, may contain an N-terminal HTH domain [Friedmanniella luteola]|uniref:Sugar kinase of the NBD/HSP70 family, may contain an N-terminal HTH domain n=1 Tax=Friedmanniella luteola TaxID=546871 RepID=A0A1H1XFC2_9ACTN|nr:ROK family transcriptional regulator [Friedmanniella luteola]SDT07831.1 Sugar kinase of the NBD/HSP70 family, may contain an N-terminal HTH domain [Friedmanniella luteola]
MTLEEGRQLPRLALLRELTDQHVLARLLDGGALTRAELATRTGISKPTISESVRRLVEGGLLEESGQQTGKRGPSGTFYRVRRDAATALAVSVGPDGVQVESYDVTGRPTGRLRHAVAVPTDAEHLGPLLGHTVRAAVAAATGPVRTVSVSVAGPVDQATGRLVALPDSPFVLGELAPRELLAPLLDVAPRIDNDVNWAALAEHAEGAARDLDEFFFVYLGPGIGAASVSGGAVRHGAGGLAGELAHVLTVGPDGRGVRLVAALAAQGLLLPGSPALDVERVLAVLASRSAPDREAGDQLARAVAGALASVTALLNPRAVVLGGPWGGADGFSSRVRAALAGLAAVPTELRTSTLGADAALSGARIDAVRRMQAALGGVPGTRHLPERENGPSGVPA